MNSPTAAGPTESAQDIDAPAEPLAEDPSGAVVDAINQVFALFRINYHNQFYAAFGDTTVLNQAKRLWLDVLRRHAPDQILRAARQVIETSEYFPTLHRMLAACDDQLTVAGLPSAEDAYREACNAPSPKRAHAWSHPAVYHAGRLTGWYELAHRPQAVTWPLFKQHYQQLRRQQIAVPLCAPDSATATIDDGAPPPRAVQRELLSALRQKLDL